MAQSAPGYLSVYGARIHYELAGEGETVVFVHGFACDLSMWEPQIPDFSSRFRTLRYDARGFGLSSLPGAEPYGHYHDLAAMIEQLDLAPAHVVGLSRGGSIALNFAITYPRLLRKLILAGASPGPAQAHKVQDSGPNEGYQQLLNVAREQGIDAAKRLYAQSGIFTAAQTNPEALAMVHRMLDDYSGWHFVNDDPQTDPDPPGPRAPRRDRRPHPRRRRGARRRTLPHPRRHGRAPRPQRPQGRHPRRRPHGQRRSA